MRSNFIQAVGTDMAKDKFDVCFKEEKNGRSIIKGSKTFKNTPADFKEFLQWCLKRKKKDSTLLFVMEATGVYYEDLCYFLYSKGQQVSVELPQKIKYYSKSLNIKTKTDKVDAAVIAEIGVERHSRLRRWTPPSKEFKKIRDITREVARLKKSKTIICSQLHALEYAHESLPEVLEVVKRQLDHTNKLIVELEGILLRTIKEDKALYAKLKRIEAVKGLGILTIVNVIAETNGFILFNNIRQLVSYAGLDVVQDQSGNHTGKPKISKKGNKHLRSSLYMAAVSAGKWNETLRPFYQRLNERFPKKKQSLVAVMRKLLILIYTLWKSGEEYDPNHQWQGKRRREVALPAGR